MRWIARAGALVAALVPLIAAVPAAGAVDLQTVGSYADPVFVTSDPSNPDRIFVVEQGGTIALTTPRGTSRFADLDARVKSGGEQGLLSMAFAPDFASSGRFYVYYTREPDGAIEIAEMRVAGGVADPGSWRSVITIRHPDFGNHNGGQLQFGPDGHLYAATGDGGGGGDPDGNAQDPGSLLGKMIRIDPRQSGARAYSIPAGNPFVGSAAVRPEIWSFGLRNPYRFSFDRLTGALTIGDVGQGAWEEINYSPAPNAGRAINYGWNCREGRHPYEPENCPSGTAGLTDPIHEYDHDVDGGSCAVTGGYVVRDPGLSELYGRYVFADFCAGVIRSLRPGPTASDVRPIGETVVQPSSFGEDSCGRVYVASLTDDTVSRLVDTTPTVCPTAPPPPAADCTVRLDGDGKGNVLNGGPGSQRILGRGGPDRISGGEGDDCIDGGAGGDRISGNAGADELLGGVGADVIRARDGERDRVLCGKGRDRAMLDHKDRAKGCERKRRKAA